MTADAAPEYAPIAPAVYTVSARFALQLMLFTGRVRRNVLAIHGGNHTDSLRY